MIENNKVFFSKKYRGGKICSTFVRWGKHNVGERVDCDY